MGNFDSEDDIPKRNLWHLTARDSIILDNFWNPWPGVTTTNPQVDVESVLRSFSLNYHIIKYWHTFSQCDRITLRLHRKYID